MFYNSFGSSEPSSGDMYRITGSLRYCLGVVQRGIITMDYNKVGLRSKWE